MLTSGRHIRCGCLSSSTQRPLSLHLLRLPTLDGSVLCRAGAAQQPHPTTSGLRLPRQQAPAHQQPINEPTHLQLAQPAPANSSTGLCVSAASAAVCLAALALAPGAADASEGTLSGQSAQLFGAFLEQVTALGPWGPVLFVTVVMLFEMVPLFPTQPLSLASGLLFGADKGAALMLLGVTLAATNAFLIARGVGRPLAQKVIDAEMSHGDGEGSAVAKTMANVQAAIESGGLWKQLTAILLLRLTPVVPFSASNYLLGLTPLQLPAFLAGTVMGMSVWSVLYASLGGASRKLLEGGADVETLLADLGAKASALSSNIVYFTVGAAVLGGGAWLLRTYTQWPSNEEGSLTSRDEPPLSGDQPVWLTRRTQQAAAPRSSRAQGEGSARPQGESEAEGEGRPWLESTWGLLTRSLSPPPEDEEEEEGLGSRQSRKTESGKQRDRVPAKVGAQARRRG